ncbi:hypothetical protein PAXRUDRAFT_18685 [Paxillus rubicundulus Ve08.2h10]|uniref:Uncharacterized protein n=1 Tax=Paxillus rubicundulus Ve08.2h10 TaxID=930991 RepID=A0A0D0CXB8_9AGAM|nr:hypothetical protein PAXRUDRAFT_18685 [Paxillus rubicundulus Ve08.2h10]
MAVIAINKILGEVRAKYLPGAKVPSVVITAEMQMFPINQVVTRGWPLLQAILKPGPEVSTHIWAQVPKLILKGKGVDPLEWGGAMEAGGSKVEGKQASDGNQGGKGGEKGKKKKEGKEKKKKKEKLAKGSDGGQESGAVGSELGGLIVGGDSGAVTNEETRGQSQERKLKKKLQICSCSQLSKAWESINAKDGVQLQASTSSNPTVMPSEPSTDACDHCIMNTKECTRWFKMGIPMGACMPCYQAKVSCNLSRHTKQPRQESMTPNPALELSKAPSPGPSQGTTRRSYHATLKAPVIPSKWAPSLGPGLLASKEAKASISKYRPKMPSVTQKAKFSK